MSDLDKEYYEAKKRMIMDCNEVFGSEAGKRVLRKLKSLCQYNMVVEARRGTDDHIDIYSLVRREAQREIITWIVTEMNKDPYAKKGIKHE